MFRRRGRGHDVSPDAADGAGGHHDRDRAPVELIVGGDHDAIDIVDREPRIEERSARHRVHRLLE